VAVEEGSQEMLAEEAGRRLFCEHHATRKGCSRDVLVLLSGGAGLLVSDCCQHHPFGGTHEESIHLARGHFGHSSVVDTTSRRVSERSFFAQELGKRGVGDNGMRQGREEISTSAIAVLRSPERQASERSSPYRADKSA
jgi:hypothetical protein